MAKAQLQFLQLAGGLFGRRARFGQRHKVSSLVLLEGLHGLTRAPR